MQQPPNDPYQQPTVFIPPQPSNKRRRFGKRAKIILASVLGGILVLCSICGWAMAPAVAQQMALSDTATAIAPVYAAQTNTAIALLPPTPTPRPTATPKPTIAPTATPTPVPTAVPTSVPTQPPVQVAVQPVATQPPVPTQAPIQPTQPPAPPPTQPPAPPPHQTVYNFDPNGGTLVYNPPANWCATHGCVSTFWTATNGYVVQCANGLYSHSGGVRGVCSRDGGPANTLYAH